MKIRERYDDFDSGLVYLLALVVPLAIGFILQLILGAIGARYGIASIKDSDVLYIIYFSIITLSLLGLYFIYNKAAKIDFKKSSLIKFKFGWLNLVVCIFIALITIFGFNSLINFFSYIMQTWGYSPDASLPLPLNNWWWLVLNLFVLAVLPAVCEEFIYRGIILNGFRKFGNVSAVVISALLFALAHGSAMQFIYQFILGIILGFVVVKTGSLIAGMVVHFVNNATVIIFNFINSSQGSASELNFTSTTIALAFVFAIVACGLLTLLIKILKERKGDNSPNVIYNSIKERHFSNTQSKVIFGLACGIAAALWIVGTFL
jgi:membrane protease YdiL (CAAX protease family)